MEVLPQALHQNGAHNRFFINIKDGVQESRIQQSNNIDPERNPEAACLATVAPPDSH
jgi:hypothetical protein